MRDDQGVRMIDAPTPPPNPGEAIVRPTRLGIGPGDLAVARGASRFRGIMGHEFVGVVERVAPAPGLDDARAWVGKRVVGSPDVVCGTCERCRGGLSLHCAARRVLGLVDRDGCFADAFAIPVGNLVEVPAGVEDDRAIHALTLAAAMHVPQRLRIEGKPYVSVVGDSVLGLLAAQVMSRHNASVRVLGTNPERLARAERWGIRHRHLAEVGQRQDQDVVVEVTGTAPGLALAMRLARPRGRIVMLGSPAPIPAGDHPGADLAVAGVNELELIGVRGGRPADAIAALARRAFGVDGLISKRLSLTDAPMALTEAERSDPFKAVLEL